MKYIKFITFFSLAVSQFCEAKPIDKVVFMQASGESTVLELDNDASVNEKMIQLEEYFLSQKTLAIPKNVVSSRNYHLDVTPTEREDIAFIVINLGRSSLKKLLGLKSTLKKAGTRVDHVHPFKFLSVVFSDEELKVAILQIRERGGWVAKEFFSGMYDSLTEEANSGNLKDEFLLDFANKLEIDVSLISKVVESKDWKELINVLIEVLPRQGDPNRYDM